MFSSLVCSAPHATSIAARGVATGSAHWLCDICLLVEACHGPDPGRLRLAQSCSCSWGAIWHAHEQRDSSHAIPDVWIHVTLGRYQTLTPVALATVQSARRRRAKMDESHVVKTPDGGKAAAVTAAIAMPVPLLGRIGSDPTHYRSSPVRGPLTPLQLLASVASSTHSEQADDSSASGDSSFRSTDLQSMLSVSNSNPESEYGDVDYEEKPGPSYDEQERDYNDFLEEQECAQTQSLPEGWQLIVNQACPWEQHYWNVSANIIQSWHPDSCAPCHPEERGLEHDPEHPTDSQPAEPEIQPDAGNTHEIQHVLVPQPEPEPQSIVTAPATWSLSAKVERKSRNFEFRLVLCTHAMVTRYPTNNWVLVITCIHSEQCHALL